MGLRNRLSRMFGKKSKKNNTMTRQPISNPMPINPQLMPTHFLKANRYQTTPSRRQPYTPRASEIYPIQARMSSNVPTINPLNYMYHHDASLRNSGMRVQSMPLRQQPYDSSYYNNSVMMQPVNQPNWQQRQIDNPIHRFVTLS